MNENAVGVKVIESVQKGLFRWKLNSFLDLKGENCPTSNMKWSVCYNITVRIWLALTVNILCKGIFPAIHLDELYAAQDLIHQSHAPVGHHHTSLTKIRRQSGCERLMGRVEVMTREISGRGGNESRHNRIICASGPSGGTTVINPFTSTPGSLSVRPQLRPNVIWK